MMEDADKEGKQREGSDVGVGKKILVGGLLASSAPLLLPPLVVVSVIGISVSLPYAIFLASHACTHNLMNKLLPMPNVLHQGKLLSQDAIIHTSICEQSEKASHHSPQLQVEEFVAAAEEYGSDHNEDEKETKGLLEKIRDNHANASDHRIELGDDDMNIGVDDSHTPIPSEQERQRRDYTNAADETGFDLFNFKEMSTEPQDYTNAIDLHQETSNVVVVDEHMHTDPMEHDVLCVQQQHKSAKDTEKHVKEMNSVNEEKIWKEMNAIRLIVGYEETPQASCIDELKNLYIFTGVEPPTLLNHSCTLLKINDKLHFLMSILGVKSSVP